MPDILSILQHKLDVDESSARAQLEAYVAFVKARASDSSGLEVQDLGVFRQIGSHLTFLPEEGLTSAVNYRYRSLPILTSEGQLLKQCQQYTNITVREKRK